MWRCWLVPHTLGLSLLLSLTSLAIEFEVVLAVTQAYVRVSVLPDETTFPIFSGAGRMSTKCL